MPFNMAMAGVGGRTFVLAIAAEDLALAYDIEAQITSQYPSAAPTKIRDNIHLSIAAVDLVAASTSGYAIDGDGLHDGAILTIEFASGAYISGKGGAGGNGGAGWWDTEPPAQDRSTVGKIGSNGGTAMRFGCETKIIGTGDISKGYGGGGGGGGGATSSSTKAGGGGGGGGAGKGSGGSGGTVFGVGGAGPGIAGGGGTVIADGGGGAAGGSAAGAGGRGGDSTLAAAAGASGTQLGGAAGTDGDAIDSQGFTHSEAGGITVTGSII